MENNINKELCERRIMGLTDTIRYYAELFNAYKLDSDRTNTMTGFMSIMASTLFQLMQAADDQAVKDNYKTVYEEVCKERDLIKNTDDFHALRCSILKTMDKISDTCAERLSA